MNNHAVKTTLLYGFVKKFTRQPNFPSELYCHERYTNFDKIDYMLIQSLNKLLSFDDDPPLKNIIYMDPPKLP